MVPPCSSNIFQARIAAKIRASRRKSESLKADGGKSKNKSKDTLALTTTVTAPLMDAASN